MRCTSECSGIGAKTCPDDIGQCRRARHGWSVLREPYLLGRGPGARGQAILVRAALSRVIAGAAHPPHAPAACGSATSAIAASYQRPYFAYVEETR